MAELPISSMRFHHIIFPTTAVSAMNSLPKPNHLELMGKWLAVSVMRIALTFRTTMIDRALAEDLAAIFEVEASEIPSAASQIPTFICDYINTHADLGVDLLMYRLQLIAGKIHDMMENMVAFNDER